MARGVLHADVEPSSMFGDHMVLQRGMPIPVWGVADAGEEVKVSFAGQTVSTNANKSGRWKVELPALEASSEGREMVIQGAGDKILFKDLLVGEVWICSGQSNMQYGWGKTSKFPMYNWGGDADLEKLVPAAKGKPIRCFHVKVDASFSPKENCRGKWSTDVSGSAVAFGFSYYLQEALDVPVAVIVTCWGSSSIEGWMPLDMTEELPHFKEQMETLWTLPNVARVNKAIETGVRPGFVWLRQRPNLLYNAMLHPVIPYACRGMVWYQGEANANNPEQYAETLPAWLERLREGWGRDDFRLLAVMLPGYGKDEGHPDSNSWAWFRDAQMKLLMRAGTGVANTIDLGDTKNIHPLDKEPICRRLALIARKKVYGEDIVAQGPRYVGYSSGGGTITVDFRYADGLKTTDGKAPRGFWIAGEDRVWHQAEATIVDEVVALKSEKVPHPQHCRYAFSGKPDVNLVNGEELPAYPFRTDDWERPGSSGRE